MYAQAIHRTDDHSFCLFLLVLSSDHRPPSNYTAQLGQNGKVTHLSQERM